MMGAPSIAKFLYLVLCAAWLASSAVAQSASPHRHSFGDAERWAQVFDDPERDAWQKPEAVIEALDLEPDAVIADIGSGTGYFAVRLAEAVPQGRVYGVDIERDMVRYLEERARREKLDNVISIAGAPDGPKLPEKIDLALLVNTFHHIDERERYFRHLRASLKAGGRVAIIDFRRDSPVGPPEPVRIAPAQVIAELEDAGYALARERDFLPNQHFLIFRPAS